MDYVKTIKGWKIEKSSAFYGLEFKATNTKDKDIWSWCNKNGQWDSEYLIPKFVRQYVKNFREKITNGL
jgi:hypothetical protein